MHNRWIKTLMLAVLFLGLMVFIYAAFINNYVWMDEVYSMKLISHNIPSLIKLDSFDVHPPFYYILLKVLVFNNNYTLARLVSIIPYVLMIFTIANCLRRVFNQYNYWTLVLITTLSFFIVPSFLHYFLQVRMYGLGEYLITVSVVVSSNIISNPTRSIKNWLLLILLTIGAIYVNYYTYFIILIIALVLLFCLLNYYHSFKSWCKAAVVVMVGSLPGIAFAFNQFNLQRSNNLRPPHVPLTIHLIIEDLIFPFFNPLVSGYKNNFLTILEGLVGILLFLMGIVVYVIFFRNFKKFNLVKHYLVLIGPFLYIFVNLLNIVMPFIIHKHVISRYIMLVLGALLLSTLVALFLALPYLSLKQKGLLVYLGLASALCNIFTLGAINYLQGLNYNNYQNTIKKLNTNSIGVMQAPVAYTTAYAFPNKQVITYNRTSLSTNGLYAYKLLLPNLVVKPVPDRFSLPKYIVSSAKFMKGVKDYHKLPGSYMLLVDSVGKVYIYQRK